MYMNSDYFSHPVPQDCKKEPLIDNLVFCPYDPAVSITDPLARYLAGEIEHVFMASIGVGSPELTTYLARLALEFSYASRLWSIQDDRGNPVTDIDRIYKAVLFSNPESTPAKRFQYAGDLGMFVGGFYPNMLKPAYESPRFVDVIESSKRAYYVASGFAQGEEAQVFRGLSEDFELICYGLSLVSKDIGIPSSKM